MTDSPIPPDTTPRLLTPREVAKALAIGQRKLWSLTAGGDLPTVRIGRCVRYRPADLAAYIDRLAAAGVKR